MIVTAAYAAHAPKASLAPYRFERREPGPRDVQIEILYCGVCHSDIHQVRDEWGKGAFPMVPGHEIVGRVVKVGSQVVKFKEGDLAGVGCMVDSCRVCPSCQEGLEQYCSEGFTGTYNSVERGTKIPTQGGYSTTIVTDEAFVLRISDCLPLAGVAPLLCAGITTYSPLRYWKVGKGQKVGIVGLGGLGHMGLKFAHAFGAKVVLFTTSPSKTEDALRLGADEVVISTDKAQLRAHAGSFDFILSTISAPYDINVFTGLLKRQGTLTVVGIPDKDPSLRLGGLVFQRRSISGSLIGGIAETQEMLDFCADHGITSDIEMISIQQINEAYERMLRSDVKYRFVIDTASLK
jgi:uncharacterized zinc-type alcohol dehydrogenase-like protein